MSDPFNLTISTDKSKQPSGEDIPLSDSVYQGGSETKKTFFFSFFLSKLASANWINYNFAFKSNSGLTSQFCQMDNLL